LKIEKAEREREFQRVPKTHNDQAAGVSEKTSALLSEKTLEGKQFVEKEQRAG
jgi:hypothetical protein